MVSKKKTSAKEITSKKRARTTGSPAAKKKSVTTKRNSIVIAKNPISDWGRIAKNLEPGALIASTQAIQGIQILPLDIPDPEDVSSPCRKKTSLKLFPDVFTRIDIEHDPAPNTFRFIFVFNDRHTILRNVQTCNPDGFFFLPERSPGIASITRPELLLDPIKRIRIRFVPSNPSNPRFKFSFRVKYQEDFNVTGVEKPRKITISIGAI